MLANLRREPALNRAATHPLRPLSNTKDRPKAVIRGAGPRISGVSRIVGPSYSSQQARIGNSRGAVGILNFPERSFNHSPM